MSSSISSPSSSPIVPARQSVRELLAQLSDSESGSDNFPRSKTVGTILQSTRVLEESSEDDVPISGNNKLARRLAGEVVKHAIDAPNVVRSQEQENPVPAASITEDVDDLVFRPTRKLLLKKRVTKTPPETPNVNDTTSRTLSPAGSPFSNRSDKSSASSTRPVPALTQKLNDAAESSKSRFGALVEKARRQRLAREEQEKAKQEAIKAQESLSITSTHKDNDHDLLNDSDADSDTSDLVTAKRLAKDTRPMRKASKKALEEMNRETQRMNRSMQLAHQAKTKKKFTKESFFASFIHDMPSDEKKQTRTAGNSSPNSSDSTPAVDRTRSRQYSTPPTSPLPDLDEVNQKQPVVPASIPVPIDQGMGKCPDLILPFEGLHGDTQLVEKQTEPTNTRQVVRTMISNVDDQLSSGSELEVVSDRASKRKYSAFENLPKKKAKEKPSHLALRSLANVKHEKSAKSSMASAELGPNLLRAARKQAHEERLAKIERLKAAGVVIQTVEEREKEEEELEDLVEKARQEDEEIRKREKQIAKKDGTFQKDILDEEDSDEDDEDFDDQNTDGLDTASESEDEDGKHNDGDEVLDEQEGSRMIDDAASESAQSSDENESVGTVSEVEQMGVASTPLVNRTVRRKRVIDDEDEDEDGDHQASQTPLPLALSKTPYSIARSARKIIPGLQHSDDLPIGLTQAFAATMAESQTQGETPQGREDMSILSGLPSPSIDLVPQLQRFDSIDVVAESVSGSQNPPLGLALDLAQSQRVPESPAQSLTCPASQPFFELTQDIGYKFSPFAGSRFTETPGRQPHSTEETLILDHTENSPIIQRQGRLRRGQQADENDSEASVVQPESAFSVMERASKRKIVEEFNRKKSEARKAIDEAAEESDDEYAGLGGASGEDTDEEANEEDRKMIDEDTQVGKGDEAKLAKLHADRERESDEAAVSKLLKDITTGALRRKRGAGDDLELSDEDDNAARRRSAKQREFEKMRRALLKDEAIGKIAEDKRKEAFLKSIEDRDDAGESDTESVGITDQQDDNSQTIMDTKSLETADNGSGDLSQKPIEPLKPSKESQLNKFNFSGRRTKILTSRKPATLAEIRESVSFLVEEPDSQNATIDLGLSDSEDEPEAYINLDRHFQQAEADENAEDDNDDLGDFIVDDQPLVPESQDDSFKKPDLPSMGSRDRAPFSERRTKAAVVVDRLSLLRQASSSTNTSNASSKMAFFTSKASPGGLGGGPSLLRRATTNSSLGSFSGRDNVSATGVVTSKTERGSAREEKEFVRKGNTTSRNAVNYQGRQNLKEERMSARAGISKRQQKKKGGNGFLSGLLRGDTWG